MRYIVSDNIHINQLIRYLQLNVKLKTYAYFLLASSSVTTQYTVLRAANAALLLFSLATWRPVDTACWFRSRAATELRWSSDFKCVRMVVFLKEYNLYKLFNKSVSKPYYVK